jgi:hypothetical protein
METQLGKGWNCPDRARASEKAAQKSHDTRTAPIGIVVAVACLLLCASTARSMFGQSPGAVSAPSAPGPVPLNHLYWHVLLYQHFLDTQAAQQDAQGEDGSWTRNHLQIRMGFSDADFAPIRTSSVRLSSELQALDAQAATTSAAGISPANAAQLQALVAQREAYVNAEISSLKQALPPERIMAFEVFITQFYAPKPLTTQVTSTSGQATPAAVQP